MSASPSFVTPALQATADDLVIIGGGSTAATILARLREEIKSAARPIPLRIHCFDEKGFPNGGVAYGQCSPHDILNSARTEMSPWRPDGFHEWCLAQGIGGCKTDFNPRADYQAFLRDEISDVVRDLESFGVTFHQYRHDVRVERVEDLFHGHIVDAKTGQPFITDCYFSQIVIAAGYGPNKNFTALKESASPHYIHSIYDNAADLLHGHPIHKKEKPQIVFIGSGPALYDQVNRLHGYGLTNAHLTIFSGNGRPLDVRDPLIEDGQSLIVPESLLALDKPTASSLRQAIVRDFQRAISPDLAHFAALGILKHIKQPLRSLSPEEATAFHESGFLGWVKHSATPVPAQSHERLAALDHTIIQARLNEEALRIRADGIEVSTPHGTIKADLVINGTGHGRHNAPIIESLKRDGLAKVCESTGALETIGAGYILRDSDIPCIGPATHVGCDGVESFDRYVQDFVRNFVASRQSHNTGQTLTFPHV